MANIDDIAKNLTCSRLEFSSIYLRAQDNLGIAVADRYEFEALVGSADDKTAFKQALEFSKKIKDLFAETLRLLVRDGFYPKAAAEIFDGELKAALQAMSNPQQGYMDIDDIAYGLLAGKRWTGKVLIGGQPKGSGILIGPKRFLTAWHVVQELFEPLPPQTAPAAGLPSHIRMSSYRPKANPPDLEIVFDDFTTKVEGRKVAPRPVHVKADQNFCEVYCECHEDELQRKVPTPTTALEGFWDYAVITLAAPMDLERSHARLDNRVVVPDNNKNIILLQYPNGQLLQVDIDEIIGPGEEDQAIPEIRFLHQSNADHGSSGGPCFDKEFFLVGLHQGQWPKQLNGRATNRGVPMRKIKLDMEERSNLPVPGGSPDESTDDGLFWYTDQKSYDPIIGLDDFQLLIRNTIEAILERDASAASSGTIWSIQGEPGSGKSYCIDTLLTMLPNTNHLKIKLPGEKIAKMDAVKLARFICSEAGAFLKGLESFKKYNTTQAAWLRDEVTQKVLRQLDDKRSRRMVWICINNLNIYDITGKNTADFLLFLYEGVLQNPWLQIVLDGLKIDLPSTLSAATKIYTTRPKTRQEVKQYLQRFLKSGPFEKPSANMVDKFTDKLYEPYQEQLKAKSREPMKFLYLQTTALLFQFIEKLRKKD